MTDRELMQQVLEALVDINELSVGENAIFLPAEIDWAMDALRERLAQPEQKPWVGLTEVDIEEAINANCGTGLWSMAKDIEEKLKKNNT